MRTESILVRIAGALMFVGGAALAAMGLDHFAHEKLGARAQFFARMQSYRLSF